MMTLTYSSQNATYITPQEAAFCNSSYTQSSQNTNQSEAFMQQSRLPTIASASNPISIVSENRMPPQAAPVSTNPHFFNNLTQEPDQEYVSNEIFRATTIPSLPMPLQPVSVSYPAYPPPSISNSEFNVNQQDYSRNMCVPYSNNPVIQANIMELIRPKRRGGGGRKRKPTENMDPKKIKFLERNREAALKCRLRKKRNQETILLKLQLLDQENQQLDMHARTLNQQIQELRGLLSSHQFCPVYTSNMAASQSSLTSGFQYPNAM